MAQDGKVVGAVPRARSVLISFHHDVETPTEAVLDTPVRAGDLVQAIGGSREWSRPAAHRNGRDRARAT